MNEVIDFKSTHKFNRKSTEGDGWTRGLVTKFTVFVFDSLYGFVLTDQRPDVIGVGLKMNEANKIQLNIRVPSDMWNRVWDMLAKPESEVFCENETFDLFYYFLMSMLNSVFGTGPTPSEELDVKEWEVFRDGGKRRDPEWVSWDILKLKQQWDRLRNLN